jgi:hypothetical protein
MSQFQQGLGMTGHFHPMAHARPPRRVSDKRIANHDLLLTITTLLDGKQASQRVATRVSHMS